MTSVARVVYCRNKINMHQTTRAIKDIVKPILDRHGVRRSAIFGSRARGDAADDSDLDLLVELPLGATLLDLVALQQELEESVGKKVDVLTYAGLHPLLRARIEREAVVL